MSRDVIDIGEYPPNTDSERRMRDAQALYSMDPVRRRLVPRLVELLETTGADRCALVWSPSDTSEKSFSHIVLDATKDNPRVSFGADVAARGLDSALDGQVGTGRARRRKSVAYMIGSREGRPWCLVLSGARKLSLGQDIEQIFQRAHCRAISVVLDIGKESLWDHREDAGTVLSRAEAAEASADYEVAVGRYEVARSACLAMGLTDGIQATWYQGRSLRKLGRLDEALELYEVAETAARQMTDLSLAAAIMTGRGHIYRLRGNMPLARSTYEEALTVSPAGALAIPLAHYGLMIVDREVGAFATAAGHGWKAVDAYDSDDPERYGAMVVLGNILLECGDLPAAQDAYEIVLGTDHEDIDIRVTAANGLAQVAARRGDLIRYKAMLRTLDEQGRGKVQAKVMTQIFLDRARDELMLGRLNRAREAVEEATALAEKHKLGHLVIEADKTLAMLDNPKPTPQRSVVEGTNRVRGKLRELRKALSA